MEKEVGNIKFVEIDGGMRIEVTGEKFKDFADCGCMPMTAAGCCGPFFKFAKSEDSECCPPEDKEKS
jgi:hypothetical protein